MGGTARKSLVIGATLIGAYLVLKNYKGFVNDFGSASNGGVNIIRAFQGR